jgi:transposase
MYQGKVDLRKGFEGLGAIVEQHFHEQVTSGAFFVFINKVRDRMKVLYWDGDGLVVWYKRLEKGRYSKKNSDQQLMSRKEFLMLLEGITPKRLQKRYSVP